MRRAAETMVETLFVVDREAGRLFVMEGAAGLILAAGARDLHGAADEGRQRDARAEFVEPLRGEGHRRAMPTRAARHVTRDTPSRKREGRRIAYGLTCPPPACGRG